MALTGLWIDGAENPSFMEGAGWQSGGFYEIECRAYDGSQQGFALLQCLEEQRAAQARAM